MAATLSVTATKQKANNITLEDLTKDLKELAADWNELGIFLKFSDAELKKIEKDVSGVNSRTDYCFSQVVVTWLDGPKEKINPEVLADAVETCDHRNLADKIRQSAKNNTFSMERMDLNLLLEEIKHKYYTLGIGLGITSGTIKIIEKYAGDCSRCLNEMLAKYIREKSPDVDALVKAIASIRKRNLSDTIKSKYAGKSFQEAPPDVC